MPGKKHSFRTLLCLCLVAVIIAPNTILAAYATDGEPASLNLTDGIYNIVNKNTGYYLDVYDTKYDLKGRTYVSSPTQGDGQDFLIKTQPDGSYLLYPQSESGEYALRIPEGATSESKIEKSKTTDLNSHFYIFPDQSGSYTIIPAGTDDRSLVLGVAEKNSAKNSRETTLNTFSGSDQQLWDITPASVRSLTLSVTSQRVKVYDIKTITATVTPSYLNTSVVWSSSDPSVILVDETGTFCAIANGTAQITATAGNISSSCLVTVSDITANTWYSQHNVENGGWDAASLSKLYFYAGGSYKRFIVNRFNGTSDWMDEGCYLTSIAMVLHNLDARLTVGYDFRTGKSGNLEADPYTVALANTGNTGSLNGSGTLYNNPIYVVDSLICSRFNVDGKPITETTTYNVSKKAIKEALDRHPEGVIVWFKNYKDQHYIVFTECINPWETNPNKYEFIVCDPAAYERDQGDHVKFENSISYKSLYYRYTNMIMMQTFDVVK